jgi:hypothetical protein
MWVNYRQFDIDDPMALQFALENAHLHCANFVPQPLLLREAISIGKPFVCSMDHDILTL